MVDEVQYAPKLFRHLKVAVDAHRDRASQFILTGSQNFALMRAASESLAGRAEIVQLEGLSCSESRAARPDLTVEQVLLRGGFPELIAKPELDAPGFYRSYVATYLERDLRQLLQVTSLRDYERFLRSCALRTAQLLNKAELSRNVGISGSTAAQWLSALEASGQVSLMRPWFSNRQKSLVKTPKLYMCDSGLCAFLMGVSDTTDLGGSPLAGALWETLVASELRRRQIHRYGGWELHFWRDRTREADFLLHRGGRLDLADAKWTEHPGDRDTSALLRVSELLPRGSVRRRAVLCRSANAYPLSPGVQALPLDEVDWLLD